MLNLNEEVIFSDKDFLNEFCRKLRGEAYDDVTRICYKTMSEYLEDAFDCDTRLTNMIHEKISDDIYPVVSIYCNLYSDNNKVDFHLLALDENRKITKREELEFKEYCDICFSHLGGFLVRLELALDGFI